MLVRRLGGDLHTARDLAQETCKTAWEKRASVPDAPLAWLLTVAKFHLLNHWRAAKKREYEPYDDEVLGHVAAAAPADAFVDAPDLELAGRLDRLSIDEREILTLSYVDKRDSNEIAEVLGIRPSTARKRLERARKKAGQLLRGVETPKGGGNDQA